MPFVMVVFDPLVRVNALCYRGLSQWCGAGDNSEHLPEQNRYPQHEKIGNHFSVVLRPTVENFGRKSQQKFQPRLNNRTVEENRNFCLNR